MIVVGIDLAERHSAAVVLSEAGPEAEFALDAGPSSGPVGPRMRAVRAWWSEIRAAAAGLGEFATVLEDVHAFAVNPKPALRLQGGIMAAMAADGVEPVMVPALTWQRHFGYKKQPGRSSKGWASQLCVELGYEPPAWARGKQLEDLRDAYLIARFAMETEAWG